jgi:hypothetical protein
MEKMGFKKPDVKRESFSEALRGFYGVKIMGAGLLLHRLPAHLYLSDPAVPTLTNRTSEGIAAGHQKRDKRCVGGPMGLWCRPRPHSPKRGADAACGLLKHPGMHAMQKAARSDRFLLCVGRWDQ